MGDIFHPFAATVSAHLCPLSHSLSCHSVPRKVFMPLSSFLLNSALKPARPFAFQVSFTLSLSALQLDSLEREDSTKKHLMDFCDSHLTGMIEHNEK